ncbi:MAG: glycosyltransferase family 87 protein [Acidobacteria bacterium]|nr:glycosyltransferase family 87 protein [Acidobacteriota bacterium]MDA1233378.1 glycosyltransferase family 87 protein [Acidobacteriota bacterium]
MKYDNPIRVFLGLLCAAGFTALMWSQMDRALSGANDFMQLYVGAVEAGGPALYDPEASYRFQQEEFDAVAEAIIYVRPAYYALLLKPLTWLGSYANAHAAYTVLRLLAIVGFVLLWPKQGRWDAVMFTLMSLPLFVGLMNGQDTVFLLPLIAWALRSAEQGKDFQAGLALSLCAIKPHLLILVPVALLAQRRWGVLKGGLAGGVALFALSCIAGGFGWLGSFLAVVGNDVINPDLQVMPNLAGLFDGVPHAELWAGVGAVAAVAAVAATARYGSFAAGIAAATVGSLLVTGHAYVSDVVVLLPGLLAVAQEPSGPPAGKFFAFVWLGPILPLLLLIGRPASYAPQVILPLTLLTLALAVNRRGPAAEPQLTPAGSQ